MKKIGYKILLSSIFFISIGSIAHGNPPNKSYNSENGLSDLIMKIDSSETTHDKLLLSDKLPENVIREKNAGLCFDDKTISDLIRLLQDGEDGVRMNASIALGDVGSQATRALPFLEKALGTANLPTDQIGPDLGSSSTIPRAIEKIRKSQRFPDHCSSH